MNWQAKVYGRWQGFGKRNRKTCPKALRMKILREQENRCLYWVMGQFQPLQSGR